MRKISSPGPAGRALSSKDTLRPDRSGVPLMRFSRLAVVLLTLGLGAAVLTAPAADPPVSPSDEQALKAAGLKVNGPALLDFLRKRAAGQADKEQVADLIQALGN